MGGSNVANTAFFHLSALVVFVLFVKRAVCSEVVTSAGTVVAHVRFRRHRLVQLVQVKIGRVFTRRRRCILVRCRAM